MSRIEPEPSIWNASIRRSAPDLAAGADPQKATERAREVARYVADMVLELHNLARSARLGRVTAGLEVAFYEASAIADEVSIPKEELERLRAIMEIAAEFDPPANAG